MVKTKEKSGSNPKQPPPESEEPNSSSEDENEDQEEVNEGDKPAAETPDMTAIRGNERRKKISQGVTRCNVPTPQPNHTKPLGANARNASGVVTGGGNEGGVATGGGNKGGVATGGGSEAGVATGGGTDGGVVTGGGNEGTIVVVEISVDAANDKGKAVVVEEEKREKNKYPPKDSARKIIDAMEFLPSKKNERPWGEPRDRSILFCYRSSWAARVCAAKFPDKAVPKLKHQQGKFWSLDKKHPDVVALVKASTLWSGIEALQKTYDVVTVYGFRERFWPETMTFLISFGEMTITPDDAKQITGLALEGKAVFEGYNNSIPFEEL
ncbi:uncharacterized protein LOC113309534 [Papaver somniferum]|uniref:uncharacterized protein LOC113309534 n=1 Tax=Papaver somniferum TaxID=3469 RepID=UPI000E6F4F77|nr:uncharacterized protein LOC113309534 [Papaver somniferum]